MGEISLIQAGKFLIGIDTSLIISTLRVGDIKAGEINKNSPIFFLESFLLQKDLNISGSSVLVLKNKQKPKRLALIADKTLGEITVPDQLEPHPLLFPELAAKCCPKIFIHGDNVVLILDPEQLNTIHQKLKTDYGLISLDALMSIGRNTEADEQEYLPLLDSSDTIDVKKEISQPRTETKIETEIKTEIELEPEAKIDEETISTVVAWVFDIFNKFKDNKKVIISVDELPHELIQQEGLSDESLQKLIDKIILQCEKTRLNSMRNMIKEKLNAIKF